jgi:alkylation response protein AidB-like acyl-CoA dehydrogenase
MYIGDSPDEQAYRQRLREFLIAHRAELVQGVRWPETPEQVGAHRRHQRLLYDGGYAGVTWPVAYGGQGRGPMYQAIVDQELSSANLPRLINLVAIGMCGPALMAHGSEEHKQRYLRPMLTAEELWCQLFSEPSAGSDLASVRTRATRGGDGWTISGQKVWTSGAQYSEFGLLLARTDPHAPKHRGLTMFVLDMRTPGVRVVPLRQMSGDSEFNEVFLDTVTVPDTARVGEPGQGWSVALTVLGSERTLIGSAEHAGTIEELLETARRRLPELPSASEAALRQELAACWTESQANRALGYRRMTQLARGEDPGAESNAGKLTSTRLARRISDLGARLQRGDAALGEPPTDEPDWPFIQAFCVALSIAGGTDEVVKNVLGERVLGLPAEPRVAPRTDR